MYGQIEKEIQSSYYQNQFDNDGQRFVAWYVQNVHRRDMIETVVDVTDGPDDKQIDAIVVDDDASTVFVVQGKFFGEGECWPRTAPRRGLASWAQLRNFSNASGDR